MGILAAIVAALCIGSYFLGREDGSSSCEQRHIEKTIEVVKEVKKSDAKIKRKAPTDTDKPAAIKWLLDHVRN